MTSPTELEKVTRRHFVKTGLGVLGSLFIAPPSYSFFLERFWVETTQVSLTLKRMPQAFSGLRMAQFSDLHLGFYYGIPHLEEVIQRINHLKPDLICFTGDLVDDSVEGMENIIPFLKKLRAPLGKMAIFGNHDFRAGKPGVVRSILEQSGFTFLQNSHTSIQRGSSQLHIAGLDDLFGGHPDGKLALNGIPQDGFTLLLAHEPDLVDYDFAVPYPVDLVLSGHSHGGQVRLPFFGALYRPDGAFHYVEGLKTIGDTEMKLYVNRGIGTSTLPIRFNCRPEITLFTLYS